MRLRRDHGMRPGKRYWHDVVGYNFRLTNLQAAVGIGQLEAIDHILALRQTMYARYVARLRGTAGVTLQHFRAEVQPAVWAVAVRIDPAAFRLNRDGIIAHLWERGIETRPGFYPWSAMPPYHAAPAAVVDEVAAHALCLPSFPSLTESEIAEICAAFLELRR
jgi:perosamine synthetase